MEGPTIPAGKNITRIQQKDSQFEGKIWKAEVERRLLVTQINIEALTEVLRNLQQLAAKDEQWLQMRDSQM